MPTVPFQRGTMPFEAIFDAKSCVIRDLSPNTKDGLNYKLEIDQIVVATQTSRNNASIMVRFTTGLETPTGTMVNTYEDHWLFDEAHPDFEYFMSNYGQGFMASAVNGFVKHKMPVHPRYSQDGSAYNRVFSDEGQYLPENND